MSTFNEIEMTTPYGDTDNVLELNIDSSSDAYVLQDVIKLASTYTFSIWYRTDVNSQITFNVLGNTETVNSTNTWNKYVKTVTVETLDEKSIYIIPSVNIVSYFYEGYLVDGIVDTSWLPAPEDLYGEIGSVRSELTQTANKIEAKITASDGRITTLTENLEGIKGRVADAEGNITNVTQTANNIKTEIENARGDKTTLSAKIGEIESSVASVDGKASSAQQAAGAITLTVQQEYAKLTDVDTKIADTVTGTSVEYYLSTSATKVSGGEWVYPAPEWVDGKYMWTRTTTTYKNSDPTTSEPTCIAGASGKSLTITATDISYQSSSSGTATPTGTWSNNIPNTAAGQYLWTRTIIIYSDETEVTSYSVSYNGNDGSDGTGVTILGSYDTETELNTVHPTGSPGDAYIVNGDMYVWDGTNNKWKNVGRIQGEPGEKGNGVNSNSITYQASTSGTTPPTGTWSSTIPVVSEGQYLWTKTVFVYDDGSQSTLYSVSKMGNTGATGTGVASITPEYYLSTSKETQTGGSWTVTPPTWESGKYVWTRNKIVYKDPESIEYTKPICDSSWEAVNELEVKVQAQIKTTADAINLTVSQKQNVSITAIRYIRDWLNGGTVPSDSSIASITNRWIECKVISGETNIAEGLLPKCKDKVLTNVEVSNLNYYTDSMILDEDLTRYIESDIESCIELDLGSIRYDIDYIHIWHYYEDNRVYNHRLQISTDGVSWVTIYDSDIAGGYAETHDGKAYYLNNASVVTKYANLSVNLDNIASRVSDVEGNYSSIKETAEKIETIVGSNEENNMSGMLKTLKDLDDALSALKKDYDDNKETTAKSISQVSQKAEKIESRIVTVEGNTTDISNIRQDASGWKALFAKLNMYDMPSVFTNITIDIDGITIINPSTGRATKITIDEFAGYMNYSNEQLREKIFWIEEDTTKTKRLLCEKGWDTDYIKMTTNTYNYSASDGTTKIIRGTAYVKSGGAS